MVVWLFLAVTQGCLRFVIVLFHDHTHYFVNMEIETSSINTLKLKQRYKIPIYILTALAIEIYALFLTLSLLN